MATLVDVVNAKNETVDRCELPEAIFAAAVKAHVLHDVVRMQLANRRQGTADTKGRSEVSGGGKKPWKQKGTGRRAMTPWKNRRATSRRSASSRSRD